LIIGDGVTANSKLALGAVAAKVVRSASVPVTLAK
jgi:nucleotide-binding universal stress UspA family protein